MQNKINYPETADCDNAIGSSLKLPKAHMGEVLERIVRRDRMGISELARQLSVSRRTIYNWFETERIETGIIRRIGLIIDHDFSKEFPDDFAESSGSIGDCVAESFGNQEEQDTAVYYWMDKYIKLLEKFNNILSQKAKAKTEGVAIVTLLLLCEIFAVACH